MRSKRFWIELLLNAWLWFFLTMVAIVTAFVALALVIEAIERLAR